MILDKSCSVFVEDLASGSSSGLAFSSTGVTCFSQDLISGSDVGLRLKLRFSTVSDTGLRHLIAKNSKYRDFYYECIDTLTGQ